MKTVCTHCHQKYEVPDDYLQQEVSCQKCGQNFTVTQGKTCTKCEATNPAMAFNCWKCDCPFELKIEVASPESSAKKKRFRQMILLGVSAVVLLSITIGGCRFLSWKQVQREKAEIRVREEQEAARIHAQKLAEEQAKLKERSQTLDKFQALLDHIDKYRLGKHATQAQRMETLTHFVKEFNSIAEQIGFEKFSPEIVDEIKVYMLLKDITDVKGALESLDVYEGYRKMLEKQKELLQLDFETINQKELK